MYSTTWYTTFAPPAGSSAEAELSAITALIPPHQFPRIIDVGCGTGRVLCPLASRGYAVTGIDINAAAVAIARRACPSATLVVLDQRDVGAPRWMFDAALVLWNSLGFGSIQDDLTTLAGLNSVLRPDGVLILDLYNPSWLVQNQLRDYADSRGASITRLLEADRVVHEIRYADGTADHISFRVYEPSSISQLLCTAGFDADATCVWWKPADVTPADARYQIVARRAVRPRSAATKR